MFEFEPGAELNHDDAKNIRAILEQPRMTYGTEVNVTSQEFDEEINDYRKTGEQPGHVWHCSLSLRSEESQLSAKQWKDIAEDFVDRMGFIDPDGAKSSRWVAVHHGASKNGGDHIHLAVQMVLKQTFGMTGIVPKKSAVN